jgi:hypothetical protein
MDRLLLSTLGGPLRAVVVRDGGVIACRAMPRGGLVIGQQMTARVIAHPEGLDGALVSCADTEAILAGVTRKSHPVGAVIDVTVTAVPRAGKRARVVLSSAGPVSGWFERLHQAFPDAGVVLDDASLVPAITTLWGAPTVHHGALPLLVDAGVAADYWTALDPVMPLACGGQVIWQPTPAGHSFDVDAGGAGRRISNTQAVEAIARFLRRTGAEGLVMIGLIPIKAAPEREAVRAALKTALTACAIKADVGPIDRLGVLSLSVPRQGLALDEVRLTPADWGYRRRVTDIAAEAHEALATARARTPGRRWCITVPADVHPHMGPAQPGVMVEAGPVDAFDIKEI